MDEKKYTELIRARSAPMQPISTGLSPAGALRAPVRAVLFDVYGTLFISGSGDIEVSKDSVQIGNLGTLLRRYGVSEEPESVHRAFYERIRTLHEAGRRKGVDHPEVVSERVWADVLDLASPEQYRLFSLEYELLFNPVWPCPGLETVLQKVRSGGMIMGIVSNAQFFTPLLFKAFLNRDVREIGFDPELALYSYVYGYAKPSPFLFERARERLGTRDVEPEQALYVGNDMLNDVYAASLTGFQTALYAGDRRSLRLRSEDVRCRGAAPDVTITDLEQLPDVL
jgi:putative hydrolase of the HAD superfamily